MTSNTTADDALRRAYVDRQPAMVKAEARLREIVKSTLAAIENRSLVRAELRGVRIKTLESVLNKARSHNWNWDHALCQCRDLVGCRVVCNNTQDVYRFVALLREALPIFPEEVEIQDQIATPGSNGYRAIHLNFFLDVGDAPFVADRVPCEIQVRSRLQDAWAELSHDDIYKNANIPADLRAQFEDLAGALEGADKRANSIRERLTSLALVSDGQFDLTEVGRDGLIHLFAQTFGRSPPQYLLQQAENLATQFGLITLSKLTDILRDISFQEEAASIYQSILGVRIGNEGLFLAAIRAAGRGRKWALSEASRLASEEWQEIDRVAQREALSTLPETIEAFIEEIESPEGSDRIRKWSAAFGSTSGCAMCSRGVIDAWSFGEQAIRYYGADEEVMERIEQALFRSDVDIGGDGDGSLCAYHNNTINSD